jgi:hypothetical protein
VLEPSIFTVCALAAAARPSAAALASVTLNNLNFLDFSISILLFIENRFGQSGEW